jgi:hypothetical protein
MEEEEAEWQEAQTKARGQAEVEDQDGHETMDEEDDQAMLEDKGDEDEDKDKVEDNGKVEDEDEGEGEDEEAIDVDKDEVEDEDEGEADEDDGLTPGCYVLNIDIEGLVPSRLWIRSDYIRIYDALHDYYEEELDLDDRAPSAVITGQPGIGESGCFAQGFA